MLKKLITTMAIALPVVTNIAAPAHAEIFQGTHPKLGTMTLAMHNTPVEAPGGRGYVSETFYRYRITKGSIFAYGGGDSSSDTYDSKADEVRVKDSDNYGEVCRGALARKWYGMHLHVILEYDKNTSCPVAGKRYDMLLRRQPDNVGFVLGQSDSPIEKVYLYR
ncbi:hypothetical protein IQ266_26620 [filamentous cyanobacterium LEGE 11480]|uniref:Uncharacterized protein n=1 Tax=Romeriopsis navalis LEGE 11480 TaxID=2777977 RepID=A0A928VTA6_9CYAN|nr:hypothetical protein [Romeriopsis navalis]MBE9033312.1 hypothetical protein [Romeriopsis navalis LEGE 11480]